MTLFKTTRILLGIATVAAVAMASPALAAAPDAQNDANARDLAKPVDRFIQAFNRWDVELPPGVFADDCVVLDIFPPFIWTGAGSATRWWSLLAGGSPEARARSAALHEHMERGDLEALTVKDGLAQFIVPTTLSYSRGGAQHVIHGRWILTERQEGVGWVITAHAFATIDMS